MKGKNDELRLKAGVTVFHDSGGIGLHSENQFRYANGEEQAMILQLMAQNQFSLDAFVTALSSCDFYKHNDGIAALEVAEFILDFEAYLESGKRV